jgi:hypothetical protein
LSGISLEASKNDWDLIGKRYAESRIESQKIQIIPNPDFLKVLDMHSVMRSVLQLKTIYLIKKQVQLDFTLKFHAVVRGK